MVTIILAAGYGTRLYPLTLDRPKALLEVGGKTILHRLVESILTVKKCEKILIVTNEKFYKSFSNWTTEFRRGIGTSSDASSKAISIEVINDGTVSNETRLGAIGDINLVLQKKGINEDILISGSDNLFEIDLCDFVEFAESKKPHSSIVLVDIKDRELAKKYGICALNANLEVTDFEEKPEFPKSTLAATALYFIPAERIGKIQAYMETDLPKDAPGNLMKWLAEEDKVFGYALKGTWYDIGDEESLKKADQELTKKEKMRK